MNVLTHAGEFEGDTLYRSDCGHTLRRERAGNTPNGNAFGGRWVLRSPDGLLIDFGVYRNDLCERNNFQLGMRAQAGERKIAE